MQTVLLTRTQENNLELKNFLLKKQYNVLEDSLINFCPDYEILENLSNYIKKYSLIITSGYAAKLLSSLYSDMNIKCYVIGKSTADFLSINGFKILGCFENLTQLNSNIPKNKELLYIRGETITGQLNTYQKEKIIYKTQYKTELNSNIIDAINNNLLDIVSLHSLKTAETFLFASKNSKVSMNKIVKLNFFV